MVRNIGKFSEIILKNSPKDADQSDELEVLCSLMTEVTNKNHFNPRGYLHIMKKSNDHVIIAVMVLAIANLYPFKRYDWIREIGDVLSFNYEKADKNDFLGSSEKFAMGLMLGIFQAANDGGNAQDKVVQKIKAIVSKVVCSKLNYLIKKSSDYLQKSWNLKGDSKIFADVYAKEIRRFTRNLGDFTSFFNSVKSLHSDFAHTQAATIYFKQEDDRYETDLGSMTLNGIMARYNDLSASSKLFLFGGYNGFVWKGQ